MNDGKWNELRWCSTLNHSSFFLASISFACHLGWWNPSIECDDGNIDEWSGSTGEAITHLMRLKPSPTCDKSANVDDVAMWRKCFLGFDTKVTANEKRNGEIALMNSIFVFVRQNPKVDQSNSISLNLLHVVSLIPLPSFFFFSLEYFHCRWMSSM